MEEEGALCDASDDQDVDDGSDSGGGGGGGDGGGSSMDVDGGMDDEITEPCIGMEFESDEAAKEHYIAYASRAGFGVRMNKSRRSRKDDAVIMRRFVCTREGFHSKRVIYDDGKKKRKRATSREGCMAMLEVTRKDHGKWVVTKFVARHTHMVSLPDKRIGPRLDDTLADPRLLEVESSNGGFNHLNSFNSRGIRVNPFGEGAEAQGLLEYLKRMQADNPAFFYAIQVDNNNCMTNVFWARTKARMAYRRFGDVVTFDTTYKKTKYMMPFATFRGVNHHLQGVTFGCCLLMDETKGSYIWLFETWLAAMGGRHPGLLITDHDKAMEGAITRVFPNTRHCFCQWHILSRCKQKLSDAYMKHATLKADLKECVTGSETIEDFQTRWEYVLNKYNLWENTWLQALYESREQWALVYQKEFFFPELLLSQRCESLNKFFKTHFNAKTSLLVFITRFDQAMASHYEKEAQADFATLYMKPSLLTPSPIEKQAASIYTKEVFGIFQEEFVESLGYYADKIEDGMILKYNVAREGENGRGYVVTFNQSDNKAKCSCCKFEYSGILCRHVIRIFFMVGVRKLPEEYIMKRWTMDSISSVLLDERVMEPGVSFSECLAAWYNDLCVDAIKYGTEGAITPDIYKVAKVALHRAFSDVVSTKSMQRKEQQDMQRCTRLQRMQCKMPLPKLPSKKAPTRAAQRDGVGRSKKA